MPSAPAVEAENEFIEVGLEMLAAQPVINAQSPNLEVGKDAVHPGQYDVRGHLADDMRIMGDVGGTGVPGPTIGLCGGAGGEIGGEKGMKAGGRIIGDLAEADATGTAAAILDLDGADDQHFALMAPSATTGDRIVFTTADDFGFIHLDQTGQWAAIWGKHAAAQFGAEQPRRFVGAKSELALQLQRRDAIGMGGHQIGGPEPGGQWQLGVVHDRPGGYRCLFAAAGAFPRPWLRLQLPRFALGAVRTDEALGPARHEEVLNAGGFVRKTLLELDQRTRKVGHGRSPKAVYVRSLFYSQTAPLA